MTPIRKTKGVSHCGLLPFTLKKSILRQKKNLIETQIFHHAKKYNLQNIPLKETKILPRYYNHIINLKFQHKPKFSSFKNTRIKIDLGERK
jgi:hypothetical protein